MEAMGNPCTVEPLYKGHLGTCKKLCYTEVFTIQRLCCVDSSPLGPTQAVCYREVSAIGGVCYKRFRHRPCIHSCVPAVLSAVIGTELCFV